MSTLTVVRPNEIVGKEAVFYPFTDAEFQRRFRTSFESTEKFIQKLEQDIRVQILLSSVVLISASNFFESFGSRELCRRHKVPFGTKDLLFAIRSEVEDFLGHCKIKRKLNPFTQSYQRPEAKRWATELQSYGSVYYREGDISARIEELWIDDLLERAQLEKESLYRLLEDEIQDRKEKEKCQDILIDIAENRRSLEFVRDYLEVQLSKRRFPEHLRPRVYDRLLDLYLRACSETMNVQVLGLDKFIVGNQQSLGKHNTQVFVHFLGLLGIRSQVMGMSDSEILELKASDEFRRMLKTYFEIVEGAESMEQSYSRLYWGCLRDKACYTYSRFATFLKGLSQLMLLLALNVETPSLPNVAVSVVGPEVVDVVLRRIAHVDKTPFSDLKERVLDEYKEKMDKALETTPLSKTI